jgi:tRNA(Ile2) C34 agmatinyltransferase TiaS
MSEQECEAYEFDESERLDDGVSRDDEKCRICGERYSSCGDGYDGMCPGCADREEAQAADAEQERQAEYENELVMRAKVYHRAVSPEFDERLQFLLTQARMLGAA